MSEDPLVAYPLGCCCDYGYRHGFTDEPSPCPQCDIHGDGSHDG